MCDSKISPAGSGSREAEKRAPARAVQIVLATSNPGKLREYREMAAGSPVELELLPNFDELPAFDEAAPTFAENAAGKALHYSRYRREIVLADDSGLVVPALGGAPGVRSARYAGQEATDEDRYRKVLREMEGKQGGERSARFVCVVALARGGKALVVASDRAEGTLTGEPRGSNGFGYDPIFFFPPLDGTFAEISPSEKNRYSHRGKAFRKALNYLVNSASAA